MDAAGKVTRERQAGRQVGRQAGTGSGRQLGSSQACKCKQSLI